MIMDDPKDGAAQWSKAGTKTKKHMTPHICGHWPCQGKNERWLKESRKRKSEWWKVGH